jgi:hypothetical protein
MKQISVDSETFQSLGYNPSNKILEAVFQSGEKYRYYNVPGSVWKNFKTAPSKGQFFAFHIRDHFDYKKLS